LEVQVRQAIDATLIAGFIVLDWLRFHDILKPEAPSAADWLSGLLSLGVFYVAIKSLGAAPFGLRARGRDCHDVRGTQQG
jgi:hypothetical protein